MCYPPPTHLAQLSCAFSCVLRFLLLWSAVLIMYPTSLAVISLTFSNYVLQPVFPNCIPPYNASRILSMVCLREYLFLVHIKLASSCKGSLSKAELMAPEPKRQAGVCPTQGGQALLPLPAGSTVGCSSCLGSGDRCAHPEQVSHHCLRPSSSFSIPKCRHVGSAYHTGFAFITYRAGGTGAGATGKEDILRVP